MVHIQCGAHAMIGVHMQCCSCIAAHAVLCMCRVLHAYNDLHATTMVNGCCAVRAQRSIELSTCGASVHRVQAILGTCAQLAIQLASGARKDTGNHIQYVRRPLLQRAHTLYMHSCSARKVYNICGSVDALFVLRGRTPGLMTKRIESF